MQRNNYKVIDSLFDFELYLESMISKQDPDIKEKTIEKIKEICIESFLLGLGARQMPVNKNKGVRL